jgi:hypothetical protein
MHCERAKAVPATSKSYGGGTVAQDDPNLVADGFGDWKREHATALDVIVLSKAGERFSRRSRCGRRGSGERCMPETMARRPEKKRSESFLYRHNPSVLG